MEARGRGAVFPRTRASGSALSLIRPPTPDARPAPTIVVLGYLSSSPSPISIDYDYDQLTAASTIQTLHLFFFFVFSQLSTITEYLFIYVPTSSWLYRGLATAAGPFDICNGPLLHSWPINLSSARQLLSTGWGIRLIPLSSTAIAAYWRSETKHGACAHGAMHGAHLWHILLRMHMPRLAFTYIARP